MGGADFGAGIVELFSSRQNRKLTRDTIYGIMGPIWEANHIWLIILVVIMWIAFPVYFNILIIYLHIPLTLVLLGITIRGVAFVFRHYDAVTDASQIWYNRLFRIGSFITPVFLGMSFGALVSGEIINTEDYTSYSFAELFIHPWLNTFTILTGLFYAALCAFLASTLLIGETQGEARKIYSRKSKIYTGLLVVIGGIVLAYGYLTEMVFVMDFLSNPVSLASIALSAVLLLPLWKSIKKEHRLRTRLLAGVQILLVIFAAVYTHFPNLMITKNAEIDLLQDTAPASVMNTLGLSLIIGGAIILPGLYHLLNSFDFINSRNRLNN